MRTDQEMNFEHYILAGLLTLGLILVAASKLVSFTDLIRNFRHGPDHDSMRSEIDKQITFQRLVARWSSSGFRAGFFFGSCIQTDGLKREGRKKA